MGYDSEAFVFYGFEIEHLDYPQCDDLQTTQPLCVRETGCHATGKPALKTFVMVRDTHTMVHDSTTHGELPEGALKLGGFTVSDEDIFYFEAMKYIEEHDLKVVDITGFPNFFWHVGTWGS